MALFTSDPTFIFLNSAKEYDITSLARSTRKTLDIILPWCQSQETSSVISLTKDVHHQAIQYAQAIDLSVVAAHNGFTVAEDAICLLELLQTTETTAEDRQEFLQGTLELARKGRKNALEAKNKFVDVRNVVEGLARCLVDDQKAKASLNYEQLVDGKLVPVCKPLSDVASQLLHGIKHLEEFRDNLTQFCAWWNLIEMETKTQIDREQQLMDSPMDKIRMKTVGARWNNHRIRYASYVNEIGLVQDHYPALFAESRKAIRNHANSDTPSQSATPLAFDIEPPSYIRYTSDPLPFTFKDASGVPRESRPKPQSSYSSDLLASHRPKQSKPRTETNVIISEEFNARSSYLSASLKHVQILEPGRAFLMLHLQCHTDDAHRCCSIKIKWRFRAADKSSDAPQVEDVAPKLSVGAHTDEGHKRNLGVNAPVQMNLAGATVGPELTGSWERSKIVSRATIITGSVRGLWSDSAEWTVVENSGAKAGVPSHFCVGIIVNYDGPFKMELMLDAKHVATAKWWRSRVEAKKEYALDVDARASEFEPYGDAARWKEWFKLINGEIDGAAHVHNQPALRRD